MREADLGDRRDMDRMVQLAVPASRQAMHDPAARAQLDRCGAGVRGELIPVRESGDVTRVTDHDRGDEWTDAEQLGECGA